MIDPFQAIVLGIIQGITEFLPISSSAHLILVRWLLGWNDPGLAFDVSLHAGTLLAVVTYFWSDWVRFGMAGVGSIFRLKIDSPDARAAWLLVIATVPGAIVGALAQKLVEQVFHGGDAGGAVSPAAIAVIAVVVLVVGVLLYAADRLNRRKRRLEDMSVLDGVAIGLAQAFAVIPGVSRSGSTITAGLSLGLSRPEAARFSFLMSGPIIFGASVQSARDVLRSGLPPGGELTYLVGMATAAVVGYAAIAFMLRFLRQNSVLVFTLYRVALGILILVLVFGRGS